MATSVNKHINIWVNGTQVENNMKSIRSAMSKLYNEIAKTTNGTKEWAEKVEKLKKLRTISEENRKAIYDTNKEMNKTGGIIDKIKEKSNSLQGVFQAIFFGKKFYNWIVSTSQEYVDAYARIDDAMTSVQKYTGLAREEVEELNEDLKKMDTRTSVEELNRLAGEAGRLGITGKKDILEFVEAADIINVALGEDLGEDAVKQIGKMAEMFGDSDKLGLRGAMLATGSAINKLGASSSASEQFLMDFTARLAGTGNQAGITQANIMGYAAVLDQNMQQVEMSATATQKLLLDMFVEPEKYAKLAGLNVKDFANLLKTDANEALLTFIETLGKKGGLQELAPIFKDLGMDGARASGVISVFATKIDDIRSAQATATAAFAQGTDVVREYEVANNNAAAKLEKAKNAAQAAKATLGQELIPILTAMMNGTVKLTKIVSSFIKILIENKDILIKIAAVYATIIILRNKELILTKLSVALHKIEAAGLATVQVATQAVALAKAKLTKNTLAAAVAQKELKVAMAGTPWGAIAVAILLAYNAIKKFVERQNAAKNAMKEFNKEVANQEAQVRYLFDSLKKTAEGSEEYNKQLNRLKELYPDIIQKHITEKGVLRDIEAAYKDVTKAIQSKVAMSMKEKRIELLTDDALNRNRQNIAKIREAILNQTNDENIADDFISSLMDIISKGGNIQELMSKFPKIDFSDKFIFKRDDFWRPIIANLQQVAEWSINTEKELKKNIDKTAKDFDPFIDKFAEIKETYEEVQAKLNEKIAKKNSLQLSINLRLEKDPIKALGKITELNKEISNLQSKLKTLKPTPTQVQKNGKSDEGPGVPPSTDKWAEFYKKLQAFRKNEVINSMQDWEKIKEQITVKYDELIEEAKTFGSKGAIEAEKLETEKGNAIITAGKSYLEKYEKLFTEFGAELLKNNTTPAEKIMQDIFASDEKWNEKIKEFQEYSEAWTDILQGMEKEGIKDGDEYNLFSKKIEDANNAITAAKAEQAKDRISILQKYLEETTELVKSSEDELYLSSLTEENRRKELFEREKKRKIDGYTAQIIILEALIAAENKLEAPNQQTIEQLENLIAQLNLLKTGVSNLQDEKGDGISGNNWQDLFNLTNIQDPMKGLGVVTSALQEFKNTAISIYNSIADAQQAAAEKELKDYTEAQDEKAKKLKYQLDAGIISQQYYDEQIAQMEKEKQEKEKKMQHDQFERDREASIIEAMMQGALSVMSTIAQFGLPWGLIPAALATAMTMAQVASIASQPNPYKKGGWIRKKQYTVMGEEGEEWVASNKLVKDKKTGPIISALEDYQRGNIQSFDYLKVSEPRWENLSQSASAISRSFVSQKTPIINHYYTTSSNSNNEIIQEIKQMNKYLSDPRNRRAIIDRKIQLQFEQNESYLKNLANL